MLKQHLLRSGLWKNIIGILALALMVFGIGWEASSVVAQGRTSSEPGALSIDTVGTYPDKRPLTSQPAAAGATTPSEEGASPIQPAGNGSGRQPLTSPPAQAATSMPSESGVRVDPTGAADIDKRPSAGLPGAGSPTAPNLWPTNWYTVIGGVFQPDDSTLTYSYGFGGCMHTTTTGRWRMSVNLPDGSVIKYIYITYRNNKVDSLSSPFWLDSYSYDATTTDLIAMNSRAGSVTGVGVFSDLSPEVTIPVDNLSYGYGFVWGGSTTSQDLCSMLVGYIPPVRYYVMVPLVAK